MDRVAWWRVGWRLWVNTPLSRVALTGKYNFQIENVQNAAISAISRKTSSFRVSDSVKLRCGFDEKSPLLPKVNNCVFIESA